MFFIKRTLSRNNRDVKATAILETVIHIEKKVDNLAYMNWLWKYLDYFKILVWMKNYFQSI